MTRVRLLGWLLVLAGLAAIVYWIALRPRSVLAQRLARGPVVVEALGTGSVESRRTIEIGFEVTGRVVRLEVDQGDGVAEGQVLASIDDELFRAGVALAEQEVALAEATLTRLEADIERAQAVLEGAGSNLTRIRSLVESGVVSEGELDGADERHKVSVAELARARAALVEGGQTLSTARRGLERAKADLARTVVTSPVDGIVLRREREVGDVAVPGAPVLRLAAADTVWASVWVDETYLAQLSVGLSARIALRSEPEQPLAGRVARIGREVDRQTRELLVDVAFDQAPPRLVFGQRVDLWIELERAEDVLRIPAAHLAYVDGELGVFVAEGSRARFRPVELGRRGREFAELVDGPAEGAVLLFPATARGVRLADGARVSFDVGDGGAP